MESRNVKRSEQIAQEKMYVRDQIVTVEELERFRIKLLNDLKQLVTLQQGPLQKKWLKSHEVRKLLKISPGTLQTLRNNKTLQSTKVGGIIFYHYEDIQRMLNGGNPSE